MRETPSPELLLRPGSLVGSWRVVGYAGRGTYGAVYRARRAGVSDAPLVALKVAVFPKDPRFLRERELLSRSHHPAIPRLLDWGWWSAGPEASYPYLVLEWVRGLPLYEWARMHPVTQRQVLQVVEQVGGALAELHLGESLHRDVKGDNLLVEPAGWAHLMDFGSGMWKGAPPLTESLLPPNTPEYRSPEALRFLWRNWSREGARYPAGPTDDLYALGVSLYRLVTGVYPPLGTAPEELKANVQESPARRLPAPALNARVGPELSALIERMLTGDPQLRGTADEVEETARTAARKLGPEGDMPLFELGHAAAEAKRVSVREFSVSGPKHSTFKRMGARRVLFAGALMLAGVSTWWVGSGPGPGTQEVESVEASGAGSRGLGDSARQQADSQGAPTAADVRAVAREMPTQPLPGQQQPPCRLAGQRVINGGCWRRLADISSPCTEDSYEWKGSCYWPVMERARPKSSNDP
jgi:hypothetical protein